MTSKQIIFGQKCVIYNKEKRQILLLKRSNYKGDGDQWDMVGGSVDFGEDSKKAIIREAEEETKIILKHPRIIDIHSRPIEDNRFFIFSLYFSDNFQMIYDNVKLSDEHIEYKWVDILDLPKYNLKNTLAYVRKEIIYYVLHYEMF